MKTEAKELSDEQIHQAVKALNYCKGFSVGSEKERQKALNAARYLGKRLVSRKNSKGGFIIFALSEN